jgi:hypothetical protein
MFSTLLADSTTFFGTINAPAALSAYGENGGLITFGSNMMRLAVIAGGIIALVNIFSAGYIYLTAGGDSKAHEKVMNKLTSSLWGLSLIILAPAIMAIMGFLLFKDASYFLKPQISGPTGGSANRTSGSGAGSGGGSSGLSGPGMDNGNGVPAGMGQ